VAQASRLPRHSLHDAAGLPVVQGRPTSPCGKAWAAPVPGPSLFHPFDATMPAMNSTAKARALDFRMTRRRPGPPARPCGATTIFGMEPRVGKETPQRSNFDYAWRWGTDYFSGAADEESSSNGSSR